MRDDPLLTATRNAAAYARHRGDGEISPDDLLLGAFHAVARLGVVKFGGITLDLTAFPEVPIGWEEGGPNPAYSKETASLFDDASAIARRDRDKRVRVVHLLAAFGDSDCGVMDELAQRGSFGSLAWRAALAEWDQDRTDRDALARNSGSLMSVDEAAAALSVHQQTIRAYIKSGKLPAFRIAGERAIRVLASDLYGLLEPLEPTSEE